MKGSLLVKQVDTELQQFYPIKDGISLINGILFKDRRILVLKRLRSEMLQYVHPHASYGHSGLSDPSASIYWPNINNDIYNMVSNCGICLRYMNANPKEDLRDHDIVDITWYKIGCDLFELDGGTYLIIVDYYSKFFEVEFLSFGYSSIRVLTKLKSIFARHGIPHILISDNGPPFNSRDFGQFCIDGVLRTLHRVRI